MLKTGEVIMEVKCSGALPLWLTSALSELQIFPSSFSKYGAAYKMCSTRYSMPQFLRQNKRTQSGVRQQNDKRTHNRTINPIKSIDEAMQNSTAQAV